MSKSVNRQTQDVEPRDQWMVSAQKSPKGLRQAFVGNLELLDSTIKLLQEAKRAARGMNAWNPYVRNSEMETQLEKLIEDCKNGRPYVVCEHFEGKGCDGCRKVGSWPKWHWEEMHK